MALARCNFAVTDPAGNIIDGASVEVRRETPGLPLVSLFSDRDGLAAISNPFTAVDGGDAGFHVAGGAYKIVATLGAFSRTWRYVANGLGAESDAVPVDGASAGFAFTFNSATSGDPGTGAFLFNNATFASITALNISETDANANSLAALIARWDDGTSTIRGELQFVKPSTGAFRAFDITGTLTDSGAYDTFSATPIASGGTISNGDECFVFFIPKGDKGDTGADGTDPGVLFTWDTGTTDADPGTGELRANNASLASATTLYISKTSRAGSDISAFLASLDDSSNTIKGTLVLTKNSNDTQTTFNVGAVTDASGYIKLAVSGHSGATSFTAADPISFQFSRAGDSGAAAGVRELLTGNRTYYVRTDGSDSNTGLVDSAGGAFLTIQKAIDVAIALDLGIYAITIQVRSGTFTGANILKPYIGAGPITILGDASTPANVIISTTSANCFTHAGGFGTWVLNGMKLQTTTSGSGIKGASCVIEFLNISFGVCVNYHIWADTLASFKATGNYTISGAAQIHYEVQRGASLDVATRTVTISTNPTNFSFRFVDCGLLSSIYAVSMTFTNIAFVTGTRYLINRNAVVDTGGGGASYFPGDVAGSVATGGQYV